MNKNELKKIMHHISMPYYFIFAYIQKYGFICVKICEYEKSGRLEYMYKTIFES